MTQNSSLELVAQAVLSFVSADNWQESKHIVMGLQDVLLTDEADYVFAMLLAQHGDDANAVRLLEDHRQLLRRCRKEGIEAAFADRLRPASSAQELTDKLLSFVQAETWGESKAYLAEHPELLTGEALAVLARLIEGQESEEARRILRRHQALLAEVRQKGLDEAFAPLIISYQQVSDAVLAFVNAKSWGESKRLVEQERELLLSEMALEVFADLLEQYKENKGAIRTLTEHRDLLIRCRKEGIEAAFAERLRPQESASQQQNRPPQQVIDAVLAFVNAKSWGESQRLVEQERELLLSEMALEVFANLLEQYKENKGAIRTLTEYRDLLIRCRKEGIEAAFAERLRSQGTPISDEVGALWEEIQVTDMPRRIELCQRALRLVERDSQAQLWAALQGTLGNSYAQNPQGNRAENIEQAIHHYEQALSLFTRQAFSKEWVTTMNNLANAYSSRIKGERAENIGQAIRCYEEALTVFLPQALPHDCRLTAYWLGRLLYDEGRFAEAREAFIMAHEAVEVMRGETRREEGRRRLGEENADLYARLVYCSLVMGDEKAAFEYATMGKGRSFVDLLSSVQIDLKNVSDKPLAEKVSQARELKTRLDALLGQLLGERVRGGDGAMGAGGAPAGHTQGAGSNNGANVSPAQGWGGAGGGAALSDAQRMALTVDLQRLREQEKALWEEIRQTYPDYFATQSAEPFTLAEAQGLANQLDATLVSYYRHDKGWIAFVIRPDLPFDSALKVVELPVTTEQLIQWWQEFNDQLWHCANSNLRRLTALYRVLIQPLQPHLPSPHHPITLSPPCPLAPSRLVLAPFDVLHLLPLAALRHKVGGESPQEARRSLRYLGNEYSVTITPSLAMLNRVKDRSKTAREQLCALAYPSHKSSEHYLPNVVPEVETIGSLFEPDHRRLFLEAAATRQAAIEHGEKSHIAHYSCHGVFDHQRVENSGLVLAGGELLNIRDIFNHLRLPNAALVTLSACETGRVEVAGGDELAGLVQAFVYAGAPTVIGRLWAVNDTATRYLFERFYRYYTQDISAADALRTAQQELRTQGYDHAYYWAAFQPYGAAYLRGGSVGSGRVGEVPPALHEIPTYVPRQPKGADEMSQPEPQAILDQATKYLSRLEQDAAELRDDLLEQNAAELQVIIDTVKQLSQQASTISTEEESLQFASDIHRAIEENNTLRLELMGQNINVKAQQQQRHLTLKRAKEATKHLPSSSQETQTVINTYQRRLTNTINLLQPKPPKPQTPAAQEE